MFAIGSCDISVAGRYTSVGGQPPTPVIIPISAGVSIGFLQTLPLKGF